MRSQSNATNHPDQYVQGVVDTLADLVGDVTEAGPVLRRQWREQRRRPRRVPPAPINSFITAIAEPVRIMKSFGPDRNGAQQAQQAQQARNAFARGRTGLPWLTIHACLHAQETAVGDTDGFPGQPDRLLHDPLYPWKRDRRGGSAHGHGGRRDGSGHSGRELRKVLVAENAARSTLST